VVPDEPQVQVVALHSMEEGELRKEQKGLCFESNLFYDRRWICMVGLRNRIKKEDGGENVVNDTTALCIKPILALR
jgi:hypothetical protein